MLTQGSALHLLVELVHVLALVDAVVADVHARLPHVSPLRVGKPGPDTFVEAKVPENPAWLQPPAGLPLEPQLPADSAGILSVLLIVGLLKVTPRTAPVHAQVPLHFLDGADLLWQPQQNDCEHSGRHGLAVAD